MSVKTIEMEIEQMAEIGMTGESSRKLKSKSGQYCWLTGDCGHNSDWLQSAELWMSSAAKHEEWFVDFVCEMLSKNVVKELKTFL